MITTIYLIRHSEKMHLPYGYSRIQPLTERGERRAKALLQMKDLRNADVAYCSPYARTVSTLRYITEADGLKLNFEERLKEMVFGGGPPNPASMDIRAKQWEDRDLRFEDGESINQCCARMESVLTEIVRKNMGKKILIGSHGVAICSLLSSKMTGIDDDFCRTLPQPAVFRLQFEADAIKEIHQMTLPEDAR